MDRWWIVIFECASARDGSKMKDWMFAYADTTDKAVNEVKGFLAEQGVDVNTVKILDVHKK